jgi:hypothetical protein
VDDPSPDYRAVLENQTATSAAAAEIIDWLNGTIWSPDGDDSGLAERIYAWYQALTPAEQAQIHHDASVRKMLEIMEIAP